MSQSWSIPIIARLYLCTERYLCSSSAPTRLPQSRLPTLPQRQEATGTPGAAHPPARTGSQQPYLLETVAGLTSHPASCLYRSVTHDRQSTRVAGFIEHDLNPQLPPALTAFMAAAMSSYLSACSASRAFCTSCSRSTILYRTVRCGGKSSVAASRICCGGADTQGGGGAGSYALTCAGWVLHWHTLLLVVSSAAE